jgi:hypothetical protein
MQVKIEGHRPADCGLAVTYPVDRVTFLSSLGKRGSSSLPRDFASSTSCYPGANDSEVWKCFEPAAIEVRKMCDRAESLGTRVRRNATIESVRELALSSRVVVLFSHFSLATLRPHDISNPNAVIASLECAAIAESIESPAECLLHEAGLEWNHFKFTAEYGLSANPLSDFLNNLIQREKQGAFSRTPSRKTFESESNDDERTLVRFARADFELAFPNIIRPADTIDFSSGPKSIFDVLGLLPAEFTGVADYSICHSSVIGEAIKGRGGDRRKCLVVVNQTQSDIHARAIICRIAIQLLAANDGKMNYVEALNSIRMRLSDTNKSG